MKKDPIAILKMVDNGSDSDSQSEVIKVEIEYDPLISKRISEVDQISTKIVVLDVGGRKFDVLCSTFSTWPNTRYRIDFKKDVGLMQFYFLMVLNFLKFFIVLMLKCISYWFILQTWSDHEGNKRKRNFKFVRWLLSKSYLARKKTGILF